MKVFRFQLYIGASIVNTYDFVLFDINNACSMAESFLSDERDTFCESVRFFECNKDKTRTVTYKLEKSNELTETLGL